jgi:hypothetical protein
MTAKTVGEYADLVMTFIDEDIDEGDVPWGVTDFSALHDHVDANEYLLHAGVPHGADIPEGQDPNGDMGRRGGRGAAAAARAPRYVHQREPRPRHALQRLRQPCPL